MNMPDDLMARLRWLRKNGIDFTDELSEVIDMDRVMRAAFDLKDVPGLYTIDLRRAVEAEVRMQLLERKSR